MARQLSDGNVVWSFLQFEDLLVDELTLFVDNKVWVERAFVASVIWTFWPAAHSWKCDATKARVYGDVFYVATVPALDVKACGFRRECAGADYDARYANEV
jgi:hypothetical protein